MKILRKKHLESEFEKIKKLYRSPNMQSLCPPGWGKDLRMGRLRKYADTLRYCFLKNRKQNFELQ